MIRTPTVTKAAVAAALLLGRLAQMVRKDIETSAAKAVLVPHQSQGLNRLYSETVETVATAAEAAVAVAVLPATSSIILPAELVALGEALRPQAAFVARAARPVVSSGTAAQAATQAAQAAFVAALREEEAH